MSHDTDRRRQPRLERDDTLFVRIASATGEAIEEGQSVRCSTENVSQDGLRIRLSEAVPEGTFLELWIKFSDRPGTFLLKGVTKWSRRRDDDTVLVGIQLADDSVEDMAAWRATVAEKLGPGH